MLEFATFLGLWTAGVLVVFGTALAWRKAFREKERDDFDASYDASDACASAYSKQYRKPQAPPKDDREQDFQRGHGYDPRFWGPSG